MKYPLLMCAALALAGCDKADRHDEAAQSAKHVAPAAPVSEKAAAEEIAKSLIPATYTFEQNPNPQVYKLAQSLMQNNMCAGYIRNTHAIYFFATDPKEKFGRMRIQTEAGDNFFGRYVVERKKDTLTFNFVNDDPSVPLLPNNPEMDFIRINSLIKTDAGDIKLVAATGIGVGRADLACGDPNVGSEVWKADFAFWIGRAQS